MRGAAVPQRTRSGYQLFRHRGRKMPTCLLPVNRGLDRRDTHKYRTGRPVFISFWSWPPYGLVTAARSNDASKVAFCASGFWRKFLTFRVTKFLLHVCKSLLCCLFVIICIFTGMHLYIAERPSRYPVKPGVEIQFAESSDGRALYVLSGSDRQECLWVIDQATRRGMKTIDGIYFPSSVIVVPGAQVRQPSKSISRSGNSALDKANEEYTQIYKAGASIDFYCLIASVDHPRAGVVVSCVKPGGRYVMEWGAGDPEVFNKAASRFAPNDIVHARCTVLPQQTSDQLELSCAPPVRAKQ